MARTMLQVDILYSLMTWNNPLTIEYVPRALCEQLTRRVVIDAPPTTTTTTITTTLQTTTATVTADMDFRTPQKAQTEGVTLSIDVPDCNFPLLYMGASVLPPPLNISDNINLGEWEPAALQVLELGRLLRENRESIIKTYGFSAFYGIYDDLATLVVKPLRYGCAILYKLQHRLVELSATRAGGITSTERETLIIDLLWEAEIDLLKNIQNITAPRLMPTWAREAPQLRSEGCPNQDCFKIGENALDAVTVEIPYRILSTVRKTRADLESGWKILFKSLVAWLRKPYEDLKKMIEDRKEIKDLKSQIGDVRGEIERIKDFSMKSLFKSLAEKIEEVDFSNKDLLNGIKALEWRVVSRLFFWIVVMCVILTVVALILERQFSFEFWLWGTRLRIRPSE